MPNPTFPTPGVPTQGVDKRRFRIIPLTEDNASRAGIGEVVVNRKTGDFYVVNDEGELISRTSSMELNVHNELIKNVNTLSFLHNHNKRVYRLFYDDEYVRIDANLILDQSCAYYRIRDLADNAVYYISALTPIKSKGLLLAPLKNNDLYFVEFYNGKKELISMLPFSAKAAIYFESDDNTAELTQSIKIYTNKDIAFLGEDPNSLMVKVVAILDDGTEKDITDYPTVNIDISKIKFDEVGVYDITATYVYDVDKNLSFTVTKRFEVSEDKAASIKDVIVVPRKIIKLNDNSKEIRLSVIVYYGDGTADDVSDMCIVSAFDPTKFNESQTIVVKLNAGTINVFTNTYEIMVTDTGAATAYELHYTTGNELKLDVASREGKDYPTNTMYYKVRAAEDLAIYYTPTFVDIAQIGIFSTTPEHKLEPNKNVIVEFYDNNHSLLDSDVYTCITKDSL